MAEPRLMRPRQLRQYLGVSGAGLKRLRDKGLIPEPLPGTRMYDRAAVDRALDRQSDPKATMASDEDELIQRARQWGKSA
jgi:hypothetical protein